ncbi:MAG: hypothetical protein ABW116_15410 [Candidatus Sedimenticola sp. 20ELBAFRAG]
MPIHIPGKIKLVFKGVSGSVQRLIVFLVLHSTTKNDFTIGPLMTDEKGEIILTKDVVDKVISQNKEEFPMDYDGSLSDCDLLSVIVESRFDLEERVKRLMKYYPDNADILLELLKDAANSEVGLRKDIRLPTDEELISINID